MSTKIKTLMTKKLVTISSQFSVAEAAQLMKEKRIHHLPVVNHEGLLVGLISEENLDLARDSHNTPVDSVMSQRIALINVEESLRNGVLKMLQEKLNYLLAIDDDNEAVGIITTEDLLWYLSHMLEKDTESKNSLLGFLNLRTIGEAAQQISNAGI